MSQYLRRRRRISDIKIPVVDPGFNRRSLTSASAIASEYVLGKKLRGTNKG